MPSTETRATRWADSGTMQRYWDPVHGAQAAKILPGQYYVTTSGEMVVTVLGSCVAACIRDVATGVGGMNHFMLPDGDVEDIERHGAAARYGQFAMESLINEILVHGGQRERLEVKLVGGGNVLRGGMRIGERNIAFARRFLDVDGLAIAAEDVGGPYPRKAYYFPKTGRLRVKVLRELPNDTVLRRDAAYRDHLTSQPSGEVELFES